MGRKGEGGGVFLTSRFHRNLIIGGCLKKRGVGARKRKKKKVAN